MQMLNPKHMISGQIHIVDYNAEWPNMFAREAGRILSVLGNGALRIEHVGSTSVPGLAAKPTIDIVLVVTDSAKEAAYLPALEAAGYALKVREIDWFEHRMFKGPDTDINLHVFSQGCAEINRMLIFRNWMRSNFADRDLYAHAKKNLAKRIWKDVQDYADAKTGVIQEILKRAEHRSSEAC